MSTIDVKRLRNRVLWVGGAATAIIPLNFLLLISGAFWGFAVLCLLQLVLGIVATVLAFPYGRHGSKGWAAVMGILFCLVGLGGPLALGVVAMALGSGGAWGRPLRLRGRVLHPELRVGSDWTRGETPDVAGLDGPTRRALEALWLHDAQKEHASVPAFARLSWLLAAVGGPAELLEAVHRAALEEIDHTRRCFALAAGYGGRSHTAEPMPDLLLGGLDLAGEPFAHLAIESLKDGCLLEDFNADVAEACARACQEPVTRRVLEQIAREERSHAELSWRLLAFCAERGGEKVQAIVARAVKSLPAVPRPTAASGDKLPLLAAADEAAMRRHGRISDAEWSELWRVRVGLTELRARALNAPLPADLPRFAPRSERLGTERLT